MQRSSKKLKMLFNAKEEPESELELMPNKKYNLTEQLEDFATNAIILYDKKPMSFAGDYLAKQLIRSSCASALNYGDILGARTDKDRVNKLRICFKELKESPRNLNI